MTRIPPCDLSGDIFDGSWDQPEPRPATTANAQAAQIKRVRSGIADSVLAFCRGVLGDEYRTDPEFHMAELTRFVEARGHRAPDSAGRILRLLRQEERLDYEVINRAASLYRIISLEEEQA